MVTVFIDLFELGNVTTPLEPFDNSVSMVDGGNSCTDDDGEDVATSAVFSQLVNPRGRWEEKRRLPCSCDPNHWMSYYNVFGHPASSIIGNFPNEWMKVISLLHNSVRLRQFFCPYCI